MLDRLNDIPELVSGQARAKECRLARYWLPNYYARHCFALNEIRGSLDEKFFRSLALWVGYDLMVEGRLLSQLMMSLSKVLALFMTCP